MKMKMTPNKNLVLWGDVAEAYMIKYRKYEPEESNHSVSQSNFHSIYKDFKVKFQHGDIVYWHRNIGYKHFVEFGIVDLQIYSDVYVNLLTPREHRLIDGIPFEQIKFPTEYQKLPKGWTYDTKLFDITADNTIRAACEKIDFKNPNAIKQAYLDGILVEKGRLDHCVVTTDINKNGWRLVTEYSLNNPAYISSMSVNQDRLYFTYEDAQKDLDEYNNELKRQSELTEEEWAIEQIDKTLKIFQGIYKIADEEILKYRAILLSKEHIEDIEIRMYLGFLQWKYFNNRKWVNIDIDDYKYIKSK